MTIPDIFGKQIAKKVNKVLGPLVFKFIFTKVTSGTRGADLTAGTNPTETDYTVNGFVDTYSDYLIDDTRIKVGDRKIVLLGDSLPSGIFPTSDDFVTAEGTKWGIVNVKRDPAGATFECQARKS